MNRGINWKTILKYAAGVTILALSVAISLLFPGWYGEWQDDRLLEDAVLTQRENIEFLDTDSLDIASRLRTLCEAENLTWVNLGEWYGEVQAEEVEEELNSFRSGMEKWCAAGILPAEALGMLNSDSGGYIGKQRIYADMQVLEISLAVFGSEDTGIVILKDVNSDLIYYAVYYGYSAENSMHRLLGYYENEAFLEDLYEGNELTGQTEVAVNYDFMKTYGAEEAEVSTERGEFEVNAEIRFDQFSCYAGRKLISNTMGFGVSAMIGTERMEDLMNQLLEMDGERQIVLTTEEMRALVRGDLMYADFENGSMAVEENYDE